MDLEIDDFILDDGDDQLKNDLNDKWITNYVKEEKLFNKFYKEEVKNIKLYFFYIDKHKEIIKVLKNKLDISNNVLLKNDISYIINENREILNKKFILIQLLKYNFNIENKNINKFLKNSNDFIFLTKLNKITDIYWDDTIPLFKSLNSLYFIFFEKKNLKHNTKKICLKRNRKTKKKYNRELKINKSDIIKID
jgi:hypothetical protein